MICTIVLVLSKVPRPVLLRGAAQRTISTTKLRWPEWGRISWSAKTGVRRPFFGILDRTDCANPRYDRPPCCVPDRKHRRRAAIISSPQLRLRRRTRNAIRSRRGERLWLSSRTPWSYCFLQSSAKRPAKPDRSFRPSQARCLPQKLQKRKQPRKIFKARKRVRLKRNSRSWALEYSRGRSKKKSICAPAPIV